MKIIDRYILSEFFFPFISGILAFTFIIAGTQMPQIVSDSVKYAIPLIDLIRLILLKLPYIIALSIPMAVLFSTISVFGRLGNDLEIIALRANGVSTMRLFFPVLIIGFLVSMTVYYFNESVVPRAATLEKNLFLSYKNKDVPNIQKNINITEYENKKPSRIINIMELEGQLLKNITVLELNEGILERFIRAKRGRWENNYAWHFEDGIMHHFTKDNHKNYSVIEFEEEKINLKVNFLDIKNRKKRVEEMSRNEMLKKINFEQKIGNDPIRYIMNYHLKLSISFSSLIYAILGASMGLRPHRSSSALGLGLSLVVIFVYIILMSIGMGMGLSKQVPAVVAAWFPNIIVSAFSLFLLRETAKQ